MKTDKLDRYRTHSIARLSVRMDIPFYCTLTPREISGKTKGFPKRDIKTFFLRYGHERRALRNFIRTLCG